MRRKLIFAISIFFSLNSFSQEIKTYSSTDLASLRSLPERWEHFWNIHNMDSTGTLFTDDIDFVNVGGHWLKGKKEAVSDHKQKHEGVVFKNSVWTTDTVAIKYVNPCLAILHIGWSIKGDNDPDGTPRKPRQGIFTWVVVKEKTAWKLLAAHNVNIREAINLPK